MVTRLLEYEAVTPAGKVVTVPTPVTPVVVWLIAVRSVLIHKVGVDVAAPTVLFVFTLCAPDTTDLVHSASTISTMEMLVAVTVPVALTPPGSIFPALNAN